MEPKIPFAGITSTTNSSNARANQSSGTEAPASASFVTSHMFQTTAEDKSRKPPADYIRYLVKKYGISEGALMGSESEKSESDVESATMVVGLPDEAHLVDRDEGRQQADTVFQPPEYSILRAYERSTGGGGWIPLSELTWKPSGSSGVLPSFLPENKSGSSNIAQQPSIGKDINASSIYSNVISTAPKNSSYVQPWVPHIHSAFLHNLGETVRGRGGGVASSLFGQAGSKKQAANEESDFLSSDVTKQFVTDECTRIYLEYCKRNNIIPDLSRMGETSSEEGTPHESAEGGYSGSVPVSEASCPVSQSQEDIKWISFGQLAARQSLPSIHSSKSLMDEPEFVKEGGFLKRGKSRRCKRRLMSGISEVGKSPGLISKVRSLPDFAYRLSRMTQQGTSSKLSLVSESILCQQVKDALTLSPSPGTVLKRKKPLAVYVKESMDPSVLFGNTFVQDYGASFFSREHSLLEAYIQQQCENLLSVAIDDADKESILRSEIQKMQDELRVWVAGIHNASLTKNFTVFHKIYARSKSNSIKKLIGTSCTGLGLGVLKELYGACCKYRNDFRHLFLYSKSKALFNEGSYSTEGMHAAFWAYAYHPRVLDRLGNPLLFPLFANALDQLLKNLEACLRNPTELPKVSAEFGDVIPQAQVNWTIVQQVFHYLAVRVPEHIYIPPSLFYEVIFLTMQSNEHEVFVPENNLIVRQQKYWFAMQMCTEICFSGYSGSVERALDMFENNRSQVEKNIHLFSELFRRPAVRERLPDPIRSYNDFGCEVRRFISLGFQTMGVIQNSRLKEEAPNFVDRYERGECGAEFAKLVLLWSQNQEMSSKAFVQFLLDVKLSRELEEGLRGGHELALLNEVADLQKLVEESSIFRLSPQFD